MWNRNEPLIPLIRREREDLERWARHLQASLERTSPYGVSPDLRSAEGPHNLASSRPDAHNVASRPDDAILAVIETLEKRLEEAQEEISRERKRASEVDMEREALEAEIVRR